ncbi:MAG: hypothetical protein V7735_19355 [Photobacterium frigidiphilum]|uniref:hypothetical protein n=1 Tax=Photobacterium frigidiphilum TaxID=264736 RepID=UPI0030038EB6
MSQYIGQSGNTGKFTNAAHLYVAVIPDSVQVNPTGALGFCLRTEAINFEDKLGQFRNFLFLPVFKFEYLLKKTYLQPSRLPQ